MTPSNTLPASAGGSAATRMPSVVLSDKRYTYQIGPLDFARILHPKGGTGQAAFGGPVPTKRVNAKGKMKYAWADRRWSPHALATRPINITGAKFLSMGTYRYHMRGELKPAKSEANLVSMGSSWLDLDAYKMPEWKNVPPEIIREVVLNTCEDLGLPRPSLINNTGRGNLVVWTYPAQPWVCIGSRWKATQQALHEAFRFLGSDASGRTPTKWFRLPGTKNENNDQPVTVVWPIHIAEIQPTTFDTFAAAVLPHARQSKAEKEAAKAARAAAARKPRAPRRGQLGGKLGGRSYWQTLRTDLDRLFALRHGTGPVPDGAGRNAWIKALTYAAAWDMRAIDLDGYVRKLAPRCGLDEDEALAKTCSIRKRAKEAAEGIKTIWHGHKVDPRYKPKPATFVEDLAITSAEMRRANLRMLVDGARRKANALERAVASRRKSGAGSRDVSQETRRMVGEAALDMKAMGLTNAEVCLVFALMPRYLDTALRDARAIAAIGQVRKPAKAKAKADPAPTPESVPAPQPIPVATPGDPAHVSLRGTRESAPAIVIDLVAGGDDAYGDGVTAVGTYLSPDGRPLRAPRPGGRLCVRTPEHVPA